MRNESWATNETFCNTSVTRRMPAERGWIPVERQSTRGFPGVEPSELSGSPKACEKIEMESPKLFSLLSLVMLLNLQMSTGTLDEEHLNSEALLWGQSWWTLKPSKQQPPRKELTRRIQTICCEHVENQCIHVKSSKRTANCICQAQRLQTLIT